MTEIVINGLATDGGHRCPDGGQRRPDGGSSASDDGSRPGSTAETPGGSDGGGSLAIGAPDANRRDEVVPVEITGAQPEETFTLDATVTDPEGVEWRSSATDTADANGVVDCTERPSDDGGGDVPPMRWLWSMTPERDAPVVALAHATETTVSLRATAGGEAAETTVTLRTQTPETTRRRVERDGVVGTVFEPSGDGPHPGVLVLHGSGGGPLDGPAGLLAARGYATFAVEYFGDAPGVPDELVRVPVSTVERAADWLRDRPGVRDGRVGVVGWSRGGELALLAGSRFDGLAPVVSYVGSGVAWDTPGGTVAWLDDGDPVAHVPGPDAPAIDAEYLDSVPEARLADATIPVEDIDGPVLLISAGADTVWPSEELSQIAADRLADRDFSHEFDHLTYDAAGHYVTPPFLPKTDDAFGGTPVGTARADADAWPVVLKTLAGGLDADVGSGATTRGDA